MINLPSRAIHYKGGVTMVSRQDDPTYQCTACFKPWFDDELDLTVMGEIPKCPKCNSNIRKLTKQEPLKTK
ncbi:hypothetical protein Q9X98_000712 [Vibrio parahaemolyticus]|nr:hypothetical protein [Vibrio parahaemolyticus]EHR1135708.1 hypothetical protein [Vibrio parahaemolyticus]EKG2488218.1 hypothetical protein [Vibrio parahaemolyticus]ELA7319208.1 hypothetical protein [Vibrio parahaemolyticus]ELA9348636.1 hypothetical protein [Vibrio parahaemolyticus]